MRVFQYLLADPSWYKDTMEALAFWMTYDKEKMTAEMLQRSSFLETLANVFQYKKNIEFIKVLPAFLKLITESIPLNKALGPLVVPSILQLITTLSEPHSRLSTLKMLRAIYTNAENRNELWKVHEVPSLLQKLANSDPSVIVTQMADQMLHDSDPTKVEATE
jgi:hypothetical protein